MSDAAGVVARFDEEATVAYRVRFDECGPDGLARAASYLRWAQDLAWRHSESVGYDRAWYADRGMTWLVRAIELDLLAPVESGATVTATTRITGFRRVWARRRTRILDATGSPIARLHTDWVMTDHRGMPARVPAEFLARFAEPPGPFEPVRVPPLAPAAGSGSMELRVRPQEIDPLGHANNAVFVDWVDEALGGAGLGVAGPRRYRLEYLFPALPGEDLRATAWRSADEGEGAVRCAMEARDVTGDAGARLRALVVPLAADPPDQAARSR